MYRPMKLIVDCVLCRCTGCPPQPTCGIDVTPALSSVLNANLQLCAVFRTCQVLPLSVSVDILHHLDDVV